MLELVSYTQSTDPRLICYSPFCVKAQVYLKLAKVDFKLTEYEGDPSKWPNGKLPVIIHKGQTIADSHFIQQYVNRTFNVDLDAHLSAEQKARGFMAMKMCEDHLYWAILHERWFIDKNFEKLNELYFTGIPSFFRGFASRMIRSSVRKTANGHGMSRHSDEKVLELGRDAVANLAAYLGDGPFLLGDKVSSYDASVYSFVSSVLHSPIGPELEAEAKKHANLIAYDERMYQLVYAGS